MMHKFWWIIEISILIVILSVFYIGDRIPNPLRKYEGKDWYWLDARGQKKTRADLDKILSDHKEWIKDGKLMLIDGFIKETAERIVDKKLKIHYLHQLQQYNTNEKSRKS